MLRHCAWAVGRRCLIESPNLFYYPSLTLCALLKEKNTKCISKELTLKIEPTEDPNWSTFWITNLKKFIPDQACSLEKSLQVNGLRINTNKINLRSMADSSLMSKCCKIQPLTTVVKWCPLITPCNKNKKRYKKPAGSSKRMSTKAEKTI